mgnify:CR=1 FL=1
MTMLKRLAIVLAAALLLNGCGAAGGGTTQPPVVNPPAQAVQKLAVGQLPAGWEPVTGSVLEHQYLKGTSSFMIKTEAFTSTTPEEIALEAEKIFMGSFDDYERIGLSGITVAGRPAAKLTFRCNVSRMAMEFMYVYLMVGSDVYAITFGDTLEGFPQLAAEYETILSGLTIVAG